MSWEGGGGSRWGPLQGEKDSEEQRDMEKEREGEGGGDARGGRSCRYIPLLEEEWRTPSGRASSGEGRSGRVGLSTAAPEGRDGSRGDAEEGGRGLFGEGGVGRRQPGRSTPSASPRSNREWLSAPWREHRVAAGGDARRALGDGWLALLGGGVTFGIMVIRIGCVAVWRRGLSRRVISCSS